MTKWRIAHVLLAGEIRTRRLVVGRAGEGRPQGHALDRRAQPHRQAQPDEDEEGRPRLLLPFECRQGDRRRGRDRARALSRPDRRDREIRRGRPQGGRAAPEAGEPGGDQGGAAPRRDGAVEAVAPLRPAGERGGVEADLRYGWIEGGVTM